MRRHRAEEPQEAPGSPQAQDGEGVAKDVAPRDDAPHALVVRSHLIVQEQNPGAQRFWKRMGFEERGLGKQMRNGRERLFLRMTRDLEPGSELSETSASGR